MIPNLVFDFECDQCNHSWAVPVLEFIFNTLTTKEIKELIVIMEDWMK